MPTLPVQQAVKIAADFFDSMYPNHQFEEVLLEEILPSLNGEDWEVTIGYSRPIRTSTLKMLTTGEKTYERCYKIITVEGNNTHEVKSMKIREVETT